jgi:hypothetical protein
VTTTTTATVETLTAQVRVLMLGSRQVTLSVFRQLDHATIDDLDVIGRVRDPASCHPEMIDVVGRHKHTGALCRFALALHPNADRTNFFVRGRWLDADEAQPLINLWDELERLPLIVLAGLK